VLRIHDNASYLLHAEELEAQEISFTLIEANCLSKAEQDADAKEKFEAITALTRLVLNDQRIGYISGLDTLQHLKHVSLRGNRIKAIRGLENLHLIEVLALGDNEIEKIQGIAHLSELRTLDLSNNRIQQIEVQQLEQMPASLASLQLNGNPCTIVPNYRALVVASLPVLLELDCVQVQPVERVLAQRTQNPTSNRATRANPPVVPSQNSAAATESGAFSNIIYSEVYNAALSDATTKLAEMQGDLTSRAKARSQAIKERRQKLLEQQSDS